MNDDRAMRRVVFTGVRQIEALRRGVVELNCAQLPCATDRIHHIEVDLRPIECAVADLQFIRQSCAFERTAQRRLGIVPHFVTADPLLRPRREFQARRQAKRAVIAKNHRHQTMDFVGNLALQQIDVAIILLELAHARQPRQCAGQFIAMQDVIGAVSQR